MGSLSSDTVGYLDITNAILRVGTLDTAGIQGIDTVTNALRANSVLVFDDMGADMQSPPFQRGAGVSRTTAPPEIDLRNASGNNFMYTGIKLPNAWVADFELSFADLNTGNVFFQTYTESTTSYGDDGYQFIFDGANGILTLEYDGTQVQQTSVAFTTGYQQMRISYDRGTWTVSRNGTRVFLRDDGERSAVYANPTSGQYLRFETNASTSRKLRFIKITNNGPWLHSNVGDVSFLTGNVGVGSEPGAYRFDVSGSSRTGTLHVSNTTNATTDTTGALTVVGGISSQKTIASDSTIVEGLYRKKTDFGVANSTASAAYWRPVQLATSTYTGMKMVVVVHRLTSDAKTITFTFRGGTVQSSTVEGAHATNFEGLDHVRIYSNTSTNKYDVYIALDSYSRAYVELYTHNDDTNIITDLTASTLTSTAPTTSGTYTLLYDSETTCDYRFVDGKVGINEMNPTQRLEITGDTTDENAQIKISSSGLSGTLTGNVHIGWNGSSYRQYTFSGTTSNACGLHYTGDAVLPYNNGVDASRLTVLGNTTYPWKSVWSEGFNAYATSGVTSFFGPTSFSLGDAVSTAQWSCGTGSYRLNFSRYTGSAYTTYLSFGQEGSYIRHTPNTTEPTMYLYYDGAGVGGSSNQYYLNNARFASVFQTDGDKDINLALVNVSRAVNTTKSCRLAFFNTDTVGAAKHGASITCRNTASNGNSSYQELSLDTKAGAYGENTSLAGYFYPQSTLVMDKYGYSRFKGPIQNDMARLWGRLGYETNLMYHNSSANNARHWQVYETTYTGNAYAYCCIEATFQRVDGVPSRQYAQFFFNGGSIYTGDKSTVAYNEGTHAYGSNYMELRYNSTTGKATVLCLVDSFATCTVNMKWGSATDIPDPFGYSAGSRDASWASTNYPTLGVTTRHPYQTNRGQDSSLMMSASPGGYYEGLKVTNYNVNYGSAAGMGYYVSAYSNTFPNNTYASTAYGFSDIYYPNAFYVWYQLGASPPGSTTPTPQIVTSSSGNVSMEGGSSWGPGGNGESRLTIRQDIQYQDFGNSAYNGYNVKPQLVIKNATGTATHTVLGWGANASGATHDAMLGAIAFYRSGTGNYGLGGLFGISVTNDSASVADTVGVSVGEAFNQMAFCVYSGGTVGLANKNNTNTGFATTISTLWSGNIRAYTTNASKFIHLDEGNLDTTKYGTVQITRAANPGDNMGHLSLIRNGNQVRVLGYQNNSNRFVISTWNTTGDPAQSSYGVYMDNTSTSWSSLSDRRLKIVYGSVEKDVLHRLDQLEPVYYHFKNECNVNPFGNGLTGDCDTKRIGFIAQSVRPHFPEVVNVDQNGYLGLQYTEMIPINTAAIQALHKKVREAPYETTTVSGVSFSDMQTRSNLLVSRNGDEVTLSSVKNDKAVYGVIVDNREKTVDRETLVQTTGEGWCWVTNADGPLEAGDYVTTSNVLPGYATRQDDDVHRNYTVGKILHDVKFDYKMVPVKRKIRETVDVKYYRKTVSHIVSDDVWNSTPEADRFVGDEVYYTHTEEEKAHTLEEADTVRYQKTMKTVVTGDVYENLPENEKSKYVFVDDDRYEYDDTIRIESDVYELLTADEKTQYERLLIKLKVEEIFAYGYDQKSDDEKEGWVRHTRPAKMVYHRHDVPTQEEGYDELVIKREERDVLDSEGQAMWEDTEEMVAEYEYRYFDVSGNPTTRHGAHTTAVLAKVLF